jgi:ubiquinone/menaquinone biosynthesis C-methylase UbiE
MTVSEKDRVRAIFEKDAPKYDRSMGIWERVLLGNVRAWVCARAKGDVLEIAVGTGLNLAHYPAGVRLTGIEYSPAMLDIARGRAAGLGRDVDLRIGDAEQLEFADESFDTVVCTYGLCTIPDDRQAVREVRRVLRPGGALVLAEHVRSPLLAVRSGQRLIAPLMLRFGGDHLLREPLEHVQAEGFVVEELLRSKAGIVERLAARKPA